MTDTASPLKPNDVIGILGGGQLGRMLTLAAAELGLKCHIYAPEGDNPAFDVAHTKTEAAYDDEAALKTFAKAVDVVTLEFENIPVSALVALAKTVPVRPGAKILNIVQDRLSEKTFIRDLGLAVPDFIAVNSLNELERAVAEIGRPSVLKTRRLGYDGKGQAAIKPDTDLADAWASVGEAPSILEAFVPFTREISVIAARSTNGETAVFDCPENRHANHILHTSTVPANITAQTQQQAEAMASRIADAFDYVGLFAVELFVIDGKIGEELLVNEIAPRVHNSGHWTQDACATSQFHQHIRAIAGWPLGDTLRHSNCVMTNLLGDDVNRWANGHTEPGTAVHIYGKNAVKQGRKMGHINRVLAK